MSLHGSYKEAVRSARDSVLQDSRDRLTYASRGRYVSPVQRFIMYDGESFLVSSERKSNKRWKPVAHMNAKGQARRL